MPIMLPSFPNPVDQVSARLVAGGVLVLATSFVLTTWTPLVAVLAYGFVARVLAGPRLSPLGLLVTHGGEAAAPVGAPPGARAAQALRPSHRSAAVDARPRPRAWRSQYRRAGSCGLDHRSRGSGVARRLLRRVCDLRLPHARRHCPESVCETCSDITLRPRERRPA